MRRRDLFRLAKTSVAAFLVAKYGPPQPEALVHWGTFRNREGQIALWVANDSGVPRHFSVVFGPLELLPRIDPL